MQRSRDSSTVCGVKAVRQQSINRQIWLQLTTAHEQIGSLNPWHREQQRHDKLRSSIKRAAGRAAAAQQQQQHLQVRPRRLQVRLLLI